MKKQLCKLTDNKNQTYGNTQWGKNVTCTSNGKNELCSDGWIHYYDSPLLAVLLNPIHADFTKPHLWEIKVGGTVKKDCGLKFGTTKVTTISRMKLPKVTTEQRIIFGILCAMKVYKDNKFLEWGNHWIDGSDRSAGAARAAEAAAGAAAGAAWAAAGAAWAAWAAEAAAGAARAAAGAAWAAGAARAAAGAARAAAGAEWAAEAAAGAARAADIDLHALALKAISYK
jgi:hypothetical protein